MEPATPQRSFLAGFIVLGALLAIGALLFLANFTGTTTPRKDAAVKDDPFAAFEAKPDGKGKLKTSKAPKPVRLPPEELWVTGEAVARPAAPPGAKNVVFVVLTAVRRDHLTPYGAPATFTPYLQELASHGARFGDVISAAPFSRAAAVAFLTGRHAASLDMVDPGPGAETKVLRADVDTLAERLRAAGWGTWGGTANFNLNSNVGFAQGFDRYRDSQPNSFHPNTRIDGNRLVNATLEALRERTPEEAARPFYLQLDLVDAHAPLRVIADREQAFDPDQPNAAYRVAVNRVDGFVKELMEGLAELGHTPDIDTYVVVLSDHGEGNETPKHHGKMHGRLLYESSVVVPWIVAGPDVGQNRVIGGLASHTDVMPTVLDLVGVPAPSGIDGRSWAGQLRGESDRTTRERAFSDTWYAAANRASIWTERMQCQKDYGSAAEPVDAFADGCFDRKTDPDFLDLKQDPELLAALDAWRAEVSTSVTASAAPAEPAPAN